MPTISEWPVLRDLPDQGAPVRIGHPVVGLDLVLARHPGLEPREARRIVGGFGNVIHDREYSAAAA